MTEPLVIVAAVNGGMQRSRDGAFVPETPEEIADDARLCREAGAAIVHVHARDDEGRNTGDVEVYADVIRRIRERTDILVQTTNGIGVRRDPGTGELVWPTDDVRHDMELIRAFYADKRGKHPEDFTPPYLREEGTRDTTPRSSARLRPA